MADGFSFDATELVKLAADLRRAPDAVVPATRAVVQRGALQIKRDWQSRWQGLSHLPMLGNSITFDTTVGRDTIEAEIGADKGRPQGALANVVEFGTPNNAPQPAGGPALAQEAPRFEKALSELLGKMLS